MLIVFNSVTFFFFSHFSLCLRFFLGCKPAGSQPDLLVQPPRKLDVGDVHSNSKINALKTDHLELVLGHTLSRRRLLYVEAITPISDSKEKRLRDAQAVCVYH